MSKAVTNEEVEDVLSSIRRLVSEDKRPLAGLSSAPKEVAAVAETVEEPAPGRLVLTPALRVADSSNVENDTGPLDLGSVARETWAPSDAVAEAQDESAPMMLLPSEDDQKIDALVHDALELETDEEDHGTAEDDYGDEAYWDDDESEAGAKHSVDIDATRYGDATPDVMPPDVINYDDEDPDDESAVYDDQWDVDSVAEDSDEEPDDLDSEPEAVVASQSPVEPEPVVQDANILTADVPLTAKIAALGAAIGKSPQDWEPDGDEANDLAATQAPAMAWEDDVEFDAKGAQMQSEPADEDVGIDDAELEEAGKGPLAAAFGGDDQLMDEEALRDLVSEIVRSELQGALGERITRNVRKLVRREIHRALTAQEME